MSLKHSILAVLSIGDCHGYQIRQEIESRTGQTWQINIGQIYSTLDRLERDNLIVAEGPNPEGQIRYSITPEGKVEALEWLKAPVSQTTQIRHELAIKLALAVTLPGVDTELILQSQKISTLRNLQTLTTAKMNASESPSDLAWLLILDSQLFALEAELRWLDHVEGLLLVSAARGLEAQNELNTKSSKRGRPTKSVGNGK
jgi:DNA-binding PadR family transcriptional regulator